MPTLETENTCFDAIPASRLARALYYNPSVSFIAEKIFTPLMPP
jgi:hypothetical protein